jgi:molybdate transport system substrate-binding protein
VTPVAVAVAVLSLAGCGSAGGAGQEPGAGADGMTADPERPAGSVLVLAAASLTDAFADMEAVFEATEPDIDVELSLAGSSSLRTQILEGAPADVFVSADQANMDQLVDAGEIDGAPVVFARNHLQIAVPHGNPGSVTGLADFADEDLLIGMCAEGVPCGDFGRQILAGAGIEPALDTSEPDVRALLTKIEAGELDAGLVYTTDVAAGGRVDGIDIPAEDNVDVTYPIGRLVNGPNPEAGSAFVAFALSDEGQEILADHGFLPPP